MNGGAAEIYVLMMKSKHSSTRDITYESSKYCIQSDPLYYERIFSDAVLCAVHYAYVQSEKQNIFSLTALLMIYK